MESPKTLDCKVVCIGEVDKHDNFQPKMLIFYGGLALRKPISDECHVKFYEDDHLCEGTTWFRLDKLKTNNLPLIK